MSCSRWVYKLQVMDQNRLGLFFCRFVLIISFQPKFTLMTMPLSLAAAVESLLGPFKRPVSVPHENWAYFIYEFMICTTLMDADTIRI